jgi:membrane protein implicated in regulation of membrane protease activity
MMFPLLHWLVQLVIFAALLFGAYWVIRLAMRHALEDADKRRSRTSGEGRSIGS